MKAWIIRVTVAVAFHVLLPYRNTLKGQSQLASIVDLVRENAIENVIEMQKKFSVVLEVLFSMKNY